MTDNADVDVNWNLHGLLDRLQPHLNGWKFHNLVDVLDLWDLNRFLALLNHGSVPLCHTGDVNNLVKTRQERPERPRDPLSSLNPTLTSLEPVNMSAPWLHEFHLGSPALHLLKPSTLVQSPSPRTHGPRPLGRKCYPQRLLQHREIVRSIRHGTASDVKLSLGPCPASQ